MLTNTISGYAVFSFLLIITGLWIPVGICLIISYIAYISYNKLTPDHPIPDKSVVVVTGCSTGIGRSFAEHLAKRGVLVYAGVRKDEDAENLKKVSKNIIPIILDITKTDDIKKARDQVEAKLQQGFKLIGVVNNAGYVETGPVELISLDKVRKQFEVNYFGQIGMSQEFIPLLRKYGSKEVGPRLVFVGSTAGFVTNSGNGIYSSSKAALESMVDALRPELKPWGIKVILVEPGAIKTNIFDSFKQGNRTLESACGRDFSYLEPSVYKHYKKSEQIIVDAAQAIDSVGSSTDWTDSVLYKTLFSKYPSVRNLVGIDAHLYYLFTFVPEIFLDTFNSNLGLVANSLFLLQGKKKKN